MFSETTQAALVDESTLSALNSIYNYQVSGETVTWTYADASYWAPAEYTQAVQAIVQTVDNLIDLDFQYTNDYRQADYAAYVYDYQFDGIAGSHTDTGWWGLTEIFYNPYETWQSNVNTFVHEFGHYLGLGEPGFDWRFDQSTPDVLQLRPDCCRRFPNVLYRQRSGCAVGSARSRERPDYWQLSLHSIACKTITHQ